YKRQEGPIPLYNVIAEIPGSEKPDEVVIVSSHLDSWHQAQGCTDNGTGSTTTLESARILMAVGAKPTRTIRFCLWGGEEQGLLGSAGYVKMHRVEMEKVSAVFNHDSGTNWAGAMTVAETMYEPMLRVFQPVLALTAPDKSHDGPVFELNKSPTLSGGGGSDHASFLAAGVPGLNWGLRGRANYFAYSWHTQWDTFEVAVPEYQRHTATVIALAALGTANLPEMLDRSGVVRGGGRQAGSYAEALFDAEMDGFKFTKITADGRGAKMGLLVGDVLTKANGQKLEAMHEVFSAARELGDDAKTMEMEVQRGDQAVKVQLDLEEMRARRARRGGGGGGTRGGERPAGGTRGGN
ncbi:MAG: M20/M25/M40 family metallo-hydrolase, partial [Planctomycetota bacterium]